MPNSSGSEFKPRDALPDWLPHVGDIVRFVEYWGSANRVLGIVLEKYDRRDKGYLVLWWWPGRSEHVFSKSLHAYSTRDLEDACDITKAEEQ